MLARSAGRIFCLSAAMRTATMLFCARHVMAVTNPRAGNFGQQRNFAKPARSGSAPFRPQRARKPAPASEWGDEFEDEQSGNDSDVDCLFGDSMQMAKRKDASVIFEIQRMASKLGLPIERVDKGHLNNLCGNRPHQGVVLKAAPLRFVSIASPPSVEETRGAAADDDAGAAAGAERARRPVWLALDEVTDPQNLGALLRTAFFLGVEGVVVSEKNSAPLTPTVSKASAGAMELMQVHSTKNMVSFLQKAREGGWTVAGAALEKSVLPSELDPDAPTILVLGSEGRGLRTNVLRACGTLVRIPRAASGAAAPGSSGRDESGLVDSLNVSVAGALLLFALLA